MTKTELDITEFQERIKTEKDFCEELFKDATIKLLAAKYAYYIKNNQYLQDITYDLMEKDWYVMGRALNHLEDGDHSPCIDFDEKHPFAGEAVKLAERLMKK